MAYYIKARPIVARVLGVEGLCGKTADGNVLLWQSDIKKTGYSVVTDALAAIGGVVLTPSDARAETLGNRCVSLPAPQDSRFVDPLAPQDPQDPDQPEEEAQQ